MAWNLKVLFIGTLGTTQADLLNPVYPTVVRGIRLSNTGAASATCTLYLASASTDAPIVTPDLPLGVGESALVDTPIMLAASGDSIQGVASVADTIECTIWGVVQQ